MATTFDEPTAQGYSDMAKNSPMADFGFMAKYPAVATQLGHDVGQEVGVDTSDPSSLTQVIHSSTYAQKLDALKSGKDNRLVQRVLSATPNPLNPKASGATQEMDVYAGQEQNVVNTMRAKAVLAQKQLAAQNKLDELSDFDAESYKSERLKKLNPTSDVDQKILGLRMQAFIAKSALRNQLRALDPVLRDQAINARMAVFNDAISTLGEIRSARVKSAEDKIGEEISSKNAQIRTAKSSVTALDGIIKTLEAQGESGDAIYKIRLERAKAQKALDKAQGSGVPDQEQNIVNYLLDDLTRRGHTPSASDIANAKRVAKETVENRKNNMKPAQGTHGALQGIRVNTGMSNINNVPLRLPTTEGETQEDME